MSPGVAFTLVMFPPQTDVTRGWAARVVSEAQGERAFEAYKALCVIIEVWLYRK